jgi:hypothetical protein
MLKLGNAQEGTSQFHFSLHAPSYQVTLHYFRTMYYQTSNLKYKDN